MNPNDMYGGKIMRMKAKQIMKASWMKYFKFIIVILSFTLVGCGLTNNNVDKTDLIIRGSKERKFLTATVYNATVSSLENIEIIQDENINYIPSNHDFSYEKIQVFQGYSFMATLDFNLKPYFENDHQGQEIEVIISLFGLYSQENDAWYDQKMIIFKTESEIVGFLCPQMGIIDDSYPFTAKLDDLYFESPMLLTNDEVIKYYERGDQLYTFTADLSDTNHIVLDITSELAFVSERESLSSTVNSNSFSELGSSQILDIMELTYIEKVNIKATIIGFDTENDLLLVTSEDATSLQTVKYNSNNTIFDLEGNEISYYDLNEGDVIEIYYIKRYSSYTPINIIVNEIIVEKIIINDESSS